MIQWIVFSRNRAYQLYGLLETAYANGGIGHHQIAVLTRYDADHLDSLDQVKAVFPGCLWVARTDFERDVRSVLELAGESVAFATDDSLFTRPVQWRAGVMALGLGVTAYSHRLGLHLRHNYPLDCPQPLPDDIFGADVLTWSWRRAAGDWGVMGSIDATQYRRSDLERWISGATSPNDLEDVLNAKVERDVAACGPIASYVTNPINVVQRTHANRHGGVSADELRDRFLSGQRPNVDLASGLVNVSCHQEVEI